MQLGPRRYFTRQGHSIIKDLRHKNDITVKPLDKSKGFVVVTTRIASRKSPMCSSVKPAMRLSAMLQRVTWTCRESAAVTEDITAGIWVFAEMQSNFWHPINLLHLFLHPVHSRLLGLYTRDIHTGQECLLFNVFIGRVSNTAVQLPPSELTYMYIPNCITTYCSLGLRAADQPFFT